MKKWVSANSGGVYCVAVTSLAILISCVAVRLAWSQSPGQMRLPATTHSVQRPTAPVGLPQGRISGLRVLPNATPRAATTAQPAGRVAQRSLATERPVQPRLPYPIRPQTSPATPVDLTVLPEQPPQSLQPPAEPELLIGAGETKGVDLTQFGAELSPASRPDVLSAPTATMPGDDPPPVPPPGLGAPPLIGTDATPIPVDLSELISPPAVEATPPKTIDSAETIPPSVPSRLVEPSPLELTSPSQPETASPPPSEPESSSPSLPKIAPGIQPPAIYIPDPELPPTSPLPVDPREDEVEVNPSVELPTVTPPTSAVMTSISDRALRELERAVGLARKGATYSARHHFESALQILAQGWDTYELRGSHTESLARGLLALQEVEDFVPRPGTARVITDIPLIMAKHRSAVLAPGEITELTCAKAAQLYLAQARDELVDAVGGLPVASQAFYGLGKLYLAQSNERDSVQTVNAMRAMALFQVALRVDERNYLAANELGVLLARDGQLQAARDVLRHSLSIQPLSETWHNLAVVHERLGEYDLAQQSQAAWHQAQEQILQASHAGIPTRQGPVQWVDKSTFERGRPGATQ